MSNCGCDVCGCGAPHLNQPDLENHTHVWWGSTMIAYAGTEFEREREYLFCTGCGWQREYEVILVTSSSGAM